jgi:hypothetical protein
MLLAPWLKYTLLCIITCLIGVYIAATIYMIRRSQMHHIDSHVQSAPSSPALPPVQVAFAEQKLVASTEHPVPQVTLMSPEPTEPPAPPLTPSPAPELIFPSPNRTESASPPSESPQPRLMQEPNVSRSTIMRSDYIPRQSQPLLTPASTQMPELIVSLSTVVKSDEMPKHSVLQTPPHNGQSSQQMLVINKADLTALVISCGETPSNVTACRDPHMSWSGCVDIAVDCVFSRYKSQSAASNEASLPTLTATKADMAAAVLSCIETPSIILACGVLSANACANRGVACVWRRLTKHK